MTDKRAEVELLDWLRRFPSHQAGLLENKKRCAQSAITADWAGFEKHVARRYAAYPDNLKYSDARRWT